MKKMIWAAGVALALVVLGSSLPSPFHKVREVRAGGPILAGTAPDAATLALLRRSCFNCHSNETSWPWYSHVAPASWLLERDVLNGRKFMNFSSWPEYGDEGQRQILDLVATQIRDGTMPPSRYVALHPEAKLTAAEQIQLIAWCKQESARLAVSLK